MMDDQTKIKLYSDALREMTSRHERLVQGLSILRQIDEIDNSNPDTDTLARSILEILARGLLAENCSLMLLDASGEYLELRAAYSPFEEQSRTYRPGVWQGKRFRAGEGIVGQVFSSGHPRRIDDVNAVENFLELSETLITVRSLLCYPLTLNGQAVGVLNLSHSRPQVFSRDTEQILSIIAQRISRALTSHALFCQVKRSESQYRLVSSSARDGVILFAQDGSILQANPAVEVLTGVSADAYVHEGVRWEDAIHPEDLPGFRVQRAEAMRHITSGQMEYRVVDRQGRQRYVEECYSVLLDEDTSQAQIVVVVRDITERRLVEEQRRQLDSTLEATPQPAIVTDPEGIVRYANPAFVQFLGYSPEELGGRRIDSLIQQTREDALPLTLEAVSNRPQLEASTIRATSRNSEGLAIEVEISVAPVRDQTGRILHFVCTWQDISRQSLLESQLREAQKLEAIGTLAGGIAHDFNNILSGLLGFTELAKRDVKPDSKAYYNLEQIAQAGKRAAALVHHILAFSHLEDHAKHPIFLHPIVKEAISLLRATVPASIEIHSHIETHCPAVCADPTGIHQVVMNLCANASQALQDSGGAITVSLNTVELSAGSPYLAEGSDLEPGLYIQFVVEDTGPGIPKELQQRIFEPYFSTKTPSKNAGHGLGLATVQGIVKGHGGTIRVESETNRGAKFEVLLPAMKQEFPETYPAVSSQTPPAPTRNLRGNERILFVDDERMIAYLEQTLLEELGYDVRAFTSSTEALDAFQEDPDAFDLVVTDLSMPQLTGTAFAREILTLRPNVPIILCSGFYDADTTDRVHKLGIREFVKKPISTEELAKTIRRLLDSYKNGNS
jgi:PAS domain S-box-containing protein